MKRKIVGLIAVTILLTSTVNAYATELKSQDDNVNQVCHQQLVIGDEESTPKGFCFFHDWDDVPSGKPYILYTKDEKSHCYKTYQNYNRLCTKCGKNDTKKEEISTTNHDWHIVSVGSAGKRAVQCSHCGLHKDGW